MTLTHGSLFTGIAGFEIASSLAGFETRWSSEIDKFCNRVLGTRFPEVPNLGNVEEVQRPAAVDVVSFGSPCQDLSVAGQRAGLDGARSGLFFEAARVISECRPAFAIWENVPGAFSSNAGRDFRVVLDTLRELGAHDVAWRVFDSQYAGVPQQRRRIYLVADFRGQRAAEVLFDAESCGGHPAPGGTEGQGPAGTLTSGSSRPGVSPPGRHVEDDYNLTVSETYVVSKPLGSNATGGFRFDLDHDTYVIQERAVSENTAAGPNGAGFRQGLAYTLEARHRGQYVAASVTSKWAKGNGGPSGDEVQNLVPVAFEPRHYTRGKAGPPSDNVPALTADADRGDGQAVVFQPLVFDQAQLTNKDNRGKGVRDRSGTLNGSGLMTVAQQSTIRRFTPLECERLQGFPDGWTCLCMPLAAWVEAPGEAMFACKCPDGPRYRAIGNAITTGRESPAAFIFGNMARLLQVL